MKMKKIVAIITIISMVLSMHVVNYADPSEEFHEGLLPGEVDPNAPTGPEVVEYYTYKEEKAHTPGSLLGDVDLNTVDRETLIINDGMDTGEYKFIGAKTILKEKEIPKKRVNINEEEIKTEINKRNKEKKDKVLNYVYYEGAITH